MRCFVCGSNSWKKIYASLVKCEKCSFVRADNLYFEFEEENLYGAEYFTGVDYWDYRSEEKALKKNFRDRLRRILKHKSKGRLLEIGCGYGYFLQLAEKYFQTTGIDLNPEITKIVAKNAKKSHIFTGDFLKVKLPHSSYDVVCLFDVIEHLKKPDQHIKKISKIVSSGGLLVIETGDIESFLARLQRSMWRLITPPTHLNYFSKKTLSFLLRKYGFVPIETAYVSIVRTIGQTFFRLLRNSRLLNKLPFLEKDFSLNTGDILFMVARKDIRVEGLLQKKHTD